MHERWMFPYGMETELVHARGQDLQQSEHVPVLQLFPKDRLVVALHLARAVDFGPVVFQPEILRLDLH